MARNKITHDYDDNGNLVVSGSQRQPTLDEAVAYLDRLGWDMPEPGLYLTAVEVDGDITVASGEVNQALGKGNRRLDEKEAYAVEMFRRMVAEPTAKKRWKRAEKEKVSTAV